MQSAQETHRETLAWHASRRVGAAQAISGTRYAVSLLTLADHYWNFPAVAGAMVDWPLGVSLIASHRR